MTDDEVLAVRARLLAKRRIVVAELSDGPWAIVASIGGQHYAFPLPDVLRVAALGASTPLPHVPEIVLGLASFDGQVLAVFDGSVWCGGPRRSPTQNTLVLLLGTTSSPLALAVDDILTSVALDPVERPASPQSAWLSGVTRAGVLVVDVDVLLRDAAFSIGRSAGRRSG